MVGLSCSVSCGVCGGECELENTVHPSRFEASAYLRCMNCNARWQVLARLLPVGGNDGARAYKQKWRRTRAGV